MKSNEKLLQILKINDFVWKIRHRAPARRRDWVHVTSCLVAFLMSGFLLEA